MVKSLAEYLETAARINKLVISNQLMCLLQKGRQK